MQLTVWTDRRCCEEVKNHCDPACGGWCAAEWDRADQFVRLNHLDWSVFIWQSHRVAAAKEPSFFSHHIYIFIAYTCQTCCQQVVKHCICISVAVPSHTQHNAHWTIMWALLRLLPPVWIAFKLNLNKPKQLSDSGTLSLFILVNKTEMQTLAEVSSLFLHFPDFHLFPSFSSSSSSPPRPLLVLELLRVESWNSENTLRVQANRFAKCECVVEQVDFESQVFHQQESGCGLRLMEHTIIARNEFLSQGLDWSEATPPLLGVGTWNSNTLYNSWGKGQTSSPNVTMSRMSENLRSHASRPPQ